MRAALVSSTSTPIIISLFFLEFIKMKLRYNPHMKSDRPNPIWQELTSWSFPAFQVINIINFATRWRDRYYLRPRVIYMASPQRLERWKAEPESAVLPFTPRRNLSGNFKNSVFYVLYHWAIFTPWVKNWIRTNNNHP